MTPRWLISSTFRCAVVLLVVYPAGLRAQETNGRTADEPPRVRAAAASSSVRIDGVFDEPFWANAVPASDFTQVEPVDGTEPTERTEIRIAFDTDALYIAARMFDSEPVLVERRLSRRDSHMSSDILQVEIDSYHDHRTAFQFTTNPSGVRADAVSTNDQQSGDGSWDPVWQVATQVDDLGWTAEMRIPFSQLRFSSIDEWGINFGRFIFRKNEYLRWSWVPNTEQGNASFFGHLEGLAGVSAPRGLEVLPYTVAQSDFDEAADPANPFNDGSVQDMTVGVDLKYGVTSDLTLDATINPDFGQVEVDPAVVNLTVFETFFDERRPFFVEGANLFRFGAGAGGFVFGAPLLFYSRRVGRAPSRQVREPGGFADNPSATRILAAGKLSGRTGAWSVGLLDAVTANEFAQVQAAGGGRRSEAVEPLTNFTVASLRRDFRNGSSGVGVLATGVQRRLNDPVFDALRSSAYTGGVDFFHRFGGNQFSLSGTLSGSRIAGDPAAIQAAQLSSARYYQRPDQSYVTFDPNATSMTGFAGSMQTGKVAGNWTYAMDLFGYSPGYEINDAGFMTQPDRIFNGFRVGRRWLQPGKVFRSFGLNATFAQTWNFGGDRVQRSAFLGGGGQLLNYWNIHANVSFTTRRLDDRATRGGPLLEAPANYSANVFMGTDARKMISVDLFTYLAQNTERGIGGGAGGRINVRPSSAVTFSVAPDYNYAHQIGFYVTRRTDPLATATFGSRYVFSELIQQTLDLTVRADVALTPDLTVQFFAQPFVASGDYQGFKEFETPGTFDFVEYGAERNSTIARDATTGLYTVDPDGPGPAPSFNFADPDFRFRSLRANLVVRWEYVPGSTLFVVWNHGRSSFFNDPTFGGVGAIGDLFADAQRNTFLVKLNYWLSP